MVSLADIRYHRDEILRISQQHGAENVRVFGSVVRGDTTATSDLDLLVTMAPDRSLLDRIALMNDLQDLLQIKVDVVNENALHHAIRADVLAQGVPL